MLYKRDFYTLIFEKVPTMEGEDTPSPRSVASLPRRGPQVNVPLRDFAPPKLKVFRRACSGAQVWNSLPENLQSVQSADSFKHMYKRTYFV